MATQPPPFSPGQYPPPQGDWRYQRRMLKDQARMQRQFVRAQAQAFKAQMRANRRTSIVGPLLLIAIGVAFLLVQTGRISARWFWEWYGHWWPALLIGAGIIMLLEWAWDNYFHTGETPVARRYVGGGVFSLLLLLGVSGVVFSAINRGAFNNHFGIDSDNMEEFWGDKHESDQSLVQALPPNSGVTIDNPRGDVTVSGTSDDNQVHIEIHKQVYTRSDSEAGSRAQQLSPNIDTRGEPDNTLKIAIPSVEGARADVTITVPRSTPANVTANRGDIHVASITGSVNLTANHGDITVAGIIGPITTRINNSGSSFSAHSVTGPVTLAGRARDISFSEINGPATMEGDFFGTTHLQHITSQVRFHTSRTDLRIARLDGELEITPHADLSADQAVGPVILATNKRNITFDRVAGDVSVTNSYGTVDITSAPPLGSVSVQNRYGSVNVTVPEQAGFTVQADTTSGDLENDFNLSQTGSDDSSHKSYSGTVGKGGPLIRISTSHGDVALKKASVQPLPPRPPAPPRITVRPEAPEPPEMPLPIEGGHSMTAGGTTVYNGNGLNMVFKEDGSYVINNRGIQVIRGADGSLFYNNSGTQLKINVDGSKTYNGRNGMRYSTHADDSKAFSGADGTQITIRPDGTKIGISPGGHTLTNAEINARLNQAEAEVNRAKAEANAEANRARAEANADRAREKPDANRR